MAKRRNRRSGPQCDSSANKIVFASSGYHCEVTGQRGCTTNKPELRVCSSAVFRAAFNEWKIGIGVKYFGNHFLFLSNHRRLEISLLLERRITINNTFLHFTCLETEPGTKIFRKTRNKNQLFKFS